MSTPVSPTVPSPLAAQRIDSIDALRGLVIVLMVADHARDYSAGTGRLTDPMNLGTVTPLLFWLRWAAHFCAPVFTLLAGLSAGLQTSRGNHAATARHLAVRGLVLIALEFTIVHLSWTFSFIWPMLYAQVIWGLGLSMVVLALLQVTPPAVRLLIGVACVAGHNLLDGVHLTEPAALHWLWAILHDRQVMPLWEGMSVRTSYPVLPMIGLMLIGEALGRWYARTPSGRGRPLAIAGALTILLFLALRMLNVYGDLHPADYSGGMGRDLLSLLNVTKYPMSLDFILMTVGPGLLLLAGWDCGVPRVARPLVVIGQVPMFLYIAHLYLLHLLAIIWAFAQGFRWADFDFTAHIGGIPKGFGFPLWQTIPFALLTVVLLYPSAGWYARLRASKRYRFTRYV